MWLTSSSATASLLPWSWRATPRFRVLVTLTAAVPLTPLTADAEQKTVNFRGSVDCVAFLGRLFRTLWEVLRIPKTEIKLKVQAQSGDGELEKQVEAGRSVKVLRRQQRRSCHLCSRFRSQRGRKRSKGDGHEPPTPSGQIRWVVAAKVLLQVAVIHINQTPKSNFGPEHVRTAKHILQLMDSDFIRPKISDLIQWTCTLALHLINVAVLKPSPPSVMPSGLDSRSLSNRKQNNKDPDP